MNLTIGSGDIGALMAGRDTVTFQNLLRKFVAADKPYYNALASPIDQFRIGAILENRYLETLPDCYMVQYKVTCADMDVFTSSLDFARIEGGKVADFDELKSLHFDDFLSKIEPIRGTEADVYIPVIRKHFKKYYNQVQAQLMCAGLQAANLVFVPVYNYDDDENKARTIEEYECAKFRIRRDEKTISAIKEKGKLFQTIKDYFKKQ